jgi:LemA protein
MQKTIFFSIILLLIISAIIAGIGLIYYNIMVGRNEKVNQKWAQVDTVLQRKLDLIPNLVETVKGYAKHEQETLLNVMEARSKLLKKLTGSERQGPKTKEELDEVRLAISSMGASLGRLFAIVENYPDLKASQNFLTLQDQLEGTENRIAVERQRYNEAVMNYNRGIKRFPGNLVAALFRFEDRPYFEVQPEARIPMKIKL